MSIEITGKCKVENKVVSATNEDTLAFITPFVGDSLTCHATGTCGTYKRGECQGKAKIVRVSLGKVVTLEPTSL
jgi:hypothetical protein